MPGPPSTFAELGLRPLMVQALRREGIDRPFPVQAAAIPDALAGRDILGHAPTGSGKTLAFGLPMLQRLAGAASAPGRPRAVVLAPTRELALQIERSLDEPALASGVRLLGIVGGVPVKRQADRLRRGVDVVIATPGRLEDLATRSEVSLSDVRIIVVDEADRMSDLGFLPQVRALLDRTPNDGQRMLFSATLDGEVDALVESYLHDPVVHRATSSVDAATAEHHFFVVEQHRKLDVATAVAARDGSTILFLRTKHAVDRMADALIAAGVPAAALHGDKSQAHRMHTLAAFADGSVPVLVATDVLARGIDVDDVSLVVHVDPPADAKDYTHRAGRTARAGRAGTVVTLSTPAQQDHVTALARDAGIDAAFVAVDASSPLLSRTTGARQPPGPPRPPVRTGAAPQRPGRAGSRTHRTHTKKQRRR